MGQTQTGRQHRGNLRRATSFAVLFVALVLNSSPAYAIYVNNLMPTPEVPSCRTAGPGPNGVPCQSDNATVTYWMESPIDKTTGTDSTAEAQINATMSGSYNGTDLNTAYDSTPVDSGTGETDIMYRHKIADFGDSSAVGYYFCNDVSGISNTKCDQGYINLKYITNTAAQMRALACHETGHAVGLVHPTESSPNKAPGDTQFECMMNAPVAAHYGLGADPNIANINRVYPN